MTGEKNRYTTTEKLWDLDDKTLKTPAHDEMVLWLLDKNNVKSILTPVFNPDHPSVILKIDNLLSVDLKYHDKSELLYDLNNSKHPANNKYIKEIADDWDNIHFEYISAMGKFNNYDKIFVKSIESEVPLTAKNGFLVGYTDLKIILNDTSVDYNHFLIKVHDLPQEIYIEVKPVIKSFGETLRQLNTYRHYINLNNTYYDSDNYCMVQIPFKLFLFTTDLRFKEAFESQGIKVLTYPE